MKYFCVENRTKRENIIAEMRINLRNVHNKYCEIKDESKANEAIDLFLFGKSENEEVEEKMTPFISIAISLEGMEEMYEESENEEFFEAMNNLIEMMTEEMRRV